MVAAMIALAIAGGMEPLPADPVQRIATKALAGHFGALEPWQREGYQALLNGHKRLRAYRTHYGPYEGRQGRVDARGRPCTMRTLAANRLKRGTWVLLLDEPELRQVLDSGARSNDARFADRHRCDLWVDRWHPDPRLRNVAAVVGIAVARRESNDRLCRGGTDG